MTVETHPGKRLSEMTRQKVFFSNLTLKRYVRVCVLILSEQTEDSDVEIGCPITCGDSKAVLLLKKFVCPGINVKCVKVSIHRH